jgi:Uma2 family endonuclease
MCQFRVNLPALDRVIKIAAAALNDDLGRKRLLCERLGVQEYWVVHVGEAIAFKVFDGGSQKTREHVTL